MRKTLCISYNHKHEHTFHAVMIDGKEILTRDDLKMLDDNDASEKATKFLKNMMKSRPMGLNTIEVAKAVAVRCESMNLRDTAHFAFTIGEVMSELNDAHRQNALKMMISDKEKSCASEHVESIQKRTTEFLTEHKEDNYCTDDSIELLSDITAIMFLGTLINIEHNKARIMLDLLMSSMSSMKSSKGSISK